MRTVQLRTYTIRPDRLDEWVEKWRTRVVPLRRELGFGIHGSWVDRERNQHVWVISYEGEDTFEEANERYWANSQRDDLNLDPNEYIVAEETRVVEEVAL